MLEGGINSGDVEWVAGDSWTENEACFSCPSTEVLKTHQDKKTPKQEIGCFRNVNLVEDRYAVAGVRAWSLRRRFTYTPMAPANKAEPVRIRVPGSGTAVVSNVTTAFKDSPVGPIA